MTILNQAVLNKARQDKFRLVIDVPKIMRDKVVTTQTKVTKDTVNADAFQFSIYGSPVPAVSIPETDAYFGGQNLPVSSMARDAYEPIDVKFVIDNEYKNYWFVWKWLDILNDNLKSYGDAKDWGPEHQLFIADYRSNATIHALDEYNKTVMQFDYKHIIPTKLDKISYNFQKPDQVDSGLTFVFGQMDINPISSTEQP